MSHLRDAEVSHHDERSKGFLLGLYAGLLIFLLVVELTDNPRDAPIRIATNIYAVQALAGAGLGFWRVQKWADGRLKTPAVASVWLCVGLVLWVIGQAVWMWAADPAAASPVEPRPDVPYVGKSDIFFIASDVVWLIALVKIFKSLRRGMTEIGPFIPIMTAALALLVGVYGYVDRWLLQNSQDPNNMLKLVLDLLYILLTFASTFLAAALLMGQNAQIPLPVHQCLRWLCGAAAVNAIAVLCFTVTEKRPKGDMLAYYNGNWVDWLFLTAMCFWGMVALKWPLRKEELQYTFCTVLDETAGEADVYQSGEIAKTYCKDADADERARVGCYVDSIRWVLDNVPQCWRVVKLGDRVVGSAFLFPVPRDLMEARRQGKLKDGELFEKVKERPLAWDSLYLADASIQVRHRERGLAFKAFKTTIENIAKNYPELNVYCCPKGGARQKLADKLEAHFEKKVVVQKIG